MKLLLISVFLISLVCFMSIPDVFGVTYPINVPMGSAAGIRDTGFSPDIIKIESGDIIKWAIFDRGIHSVTSDSGLFDSGPMEANKAGSSCFPNCKPFAYTFQDDGTYNYHCKFHSWMQGSVIVGGVGSTASAKDCTNLGCVYLDNQRYGVSEGRTVLVKIYGKVNSMNTDFVFMDIKEPSGKLTEHKIPVTSTGKFEYPLPISYDKRGMYDVVVRTGYNPSGSQLGSIWFEVVKTSAVSQQKDITSTSIILTTDSQRYEKGSIIGIAGQLIPYQSLMGMDEVTIKVSSPNGNVVNVAQTQPSSTGTFESTVNTSNWKEYGTYEIKAQYENLIKSHHIAFTTIPSSTSKTSTFLKLESVPNVFESKGSNSGVGVKFEGQLWTSDRNTYITNAKIDLIDTRFNQSVTLTTDNNGKFSTIWNWAVGNNYGVYAFYDGSNSLKFESSKSQTESFRVVQQQSIQPQSPTQSSGDFGWVWILIILGVVFAGVAAVLAKKNKKKTPIPPIPAGGGGRKRGRPRSQPSAPPSGDGPSLIGRKACPNCHWILQLPTNQNRTQTCTHCGWKTGDPIN